MDVVMEATDSKSSRRETRGLYEAQALTTSKDASTSQLAQLVQKITISSPIAPSNTIPDVLTSQSAQLVQRKTMSTTLPLINAPYVQANATPAPLPSFDSLPYAWGSPPAQLAHDSSTSLPSFDSLPYAWGSPPAQLTHDGSTPTIRPAPPNAAPQNRSLSKRPLRRQRSRRRHRDPDPTIASVQDDLDKWQRYLNKLKDHINRHKKADPNLPLDFKHKELTLAEAEVESNQLKLQALRLGYKFAPDGHEEFEEEAPVSSKKLDKASYIKKLREQADGWEGWRTGRIRMLHNGGHGRSASYMRRINVTRLQYRMDQAAFKASKLRAKIAKLEAQVDGGEVGDVEMGEMGESSNSKIGEGGDSKMGEEGTTNTGEVEGEMEKLTAGVAELCN